MSSRTRSGMDRRISSPASEAGATPCDSLASQTTLPFGAAHAPVSRSRLRASAKGTTTAATSGPRGSVSSASDALSCFLANRLRTALASTGSTLFKLTWKPRVMPSGRSIFALRGSVRRTGVPGFTSVPTPNAGPQNDGDSTWEQRRADLKDEHKNGNGFGLTLGQAVTLSAVPSPTAALGDKGVRSTQGGIMEAMRSRGADLAAISALSSVPTPVVNDATGSQYAYAGGDHDKPVLKLPGVAQLSTVASPSARDWKDSPGMSETGVDPDGSTRSTARSVAQAGATRGFWGDCDWWWGRDGRWRPAGPGVQPLAHGLPARMGRLRGYGNAIVPWLAAAFVSAFMDSLGEPS